MTTDKKLALSLFFMRITVFVALLMWTFRKILSPERSAAVFKKFYFVPGLSDNIVYVLAALQLAIIIAFVLGLFKRWTYGLVFFMHGVATITPIKQYFTPYEGSHLLFFAAWPMFAACFALYILRDQDTMFTLKLGASKGA